MLVQLEISGPNFGFRSLMEEMGLDQNEGIEDMEILDKIDIDKHRNLIETRLDEMLDDDFV